MAFLNSVNVKLQIRNDTAENWRTQNPLLERGELVAEIDTNLLKIGNGEANYNDLPYVSATVEEIQEALDSKLGINGGEVSGPIILNYVPAAANDAVNKSYVDNLVAGVGTLKRTVVDELPAIEEADENTIYMVKDALALGPDKYREYMVFNGEFVMIGDTSIDLTNYAEKNELAPVAFSGKLSDLKQDEEDIIVFDCGTASTIIS